MRIAITGATGTLGTALVRRLVADDPSAEIMGVARRLPAGTSPWSAGRGRVRWTTADLGDAGCLPRLRAAFCEVDAVVHLAWGHRLSDRTEGTSSLERVDVGGTGLVMAPAARERVAHVVHLSSAGVYSPKVDDRPVDETWPTTGIPGSTYSRHKVAAERLLDRWEDWGDGTSPTGGEHLPGVTRLRPGLVGHPGRRLAAGALLPVDRLLVLPVVHADDVADAVVRALAHRVLGAFNLAAPLPATPPVIAAALGVHVVHVPAGLLRAAASASRWSRRHPIEPGWVDLAMQVPLLDTRRAAAELGWTPAHDAEAVLTELMDSQIPSSDATTGGRAPVRTVAHRRRP